MTSPPEGSGLDLSAISIDRHAEVPIGVQLAWALRARINDGSLTPGQRLPGLRELAEATGINFNTAKAVYQRLDQEGFIDTQQGSGTYVAATARKPSHVARIAERAAYEALESDLTPREVAAALYVEPEATQGRDEEARRRRLLRHQIAVLELMLGELEADHPAALQETALAAKGRFRPRGAGPSLLDATALESVRADLVNRLATVQRVIEGDAGPASPSPAKKSSAAQAKKRTASERAPSDARTSRRKKPPARPRPTSRPAPAGG